MRTRRTDLEREADTMDRKLFDVIEGCRYMREKVTEPKTRAKLYDIMEGCLNVRPLLRGMMHPEDREETE